MKTDQVLRFTEVLPIEYTSRLLGSVDNAVDYGCGDVAN